METSSIFSLTTSFHSRQALENILMWSVGLFPQRWLKTNSPSHQGFDKIVFFHRIWSAQAMTKLGAAPALPKQNFPRQRWQRLLQQTLNFHFLVPSTCALTQKTEKPKPFFSISPQSDGLEIKRKGERGGRRGGKSHGRDKKTKPRFLSHPTLFFNLFFLVELEVFFAVSSPVLWLWQMMMQGEDLWGVLEH